MQQPPATVGTNVGFAANVLLSEGGVPLTYAYTEPISLALAAGDDGTVSNGSTLTDVPTGIAYFTNLLVNAAETDDRLLAALSVTTVPPPAPLTTPLTVSATSNAFDVRPFAAVQVTIGASPNGAAFTVDGASYISPVTLGWVIGSKHTIATTSPQTVNGGVYTFASWSDGGAISHTVTARLPQRTRQTSS